MTLILLNEWFGIDYRKELNENKKSTKKASNKESSGGEGVDDSMNVESDDEGEEAAGAANDENLEEDIAESDEAMEN